MPLPITKPPRHLNMNDFNAQTWHQLVETQDPQALYASHYDSKGKRFFNPWFRQEKTLYDILRFFLTKNRYGCEGSYFYQHIFNQPIFDPDGPDQLTMLGHSSIALQLKQQLFLFDPFISQRAFTKRRQRPCALSFEHLPANFTVIISHNHYDHLDRIFVRQYQSAHYVCPLGVAHLLSSWGAKHITALDWWQHISIADINIICLPAHHWSRRLTQGTNRSLWASWLLRTDDKQIFLSGDSAYFVGYREIGRRFPNIDLALLP